jgi:SAM-dependent methyltransferase
MTNKETRREDLDLVTEIYTNDPFERENFFADTGHVKRCIHYAKDRELWLELGLGRGIVLRHISEAMKSVLVLDGSPELVRRYSGLIPNVQIELTYFEDFETDRKFPNIGMGFILEHVDDPAVILNKYRHILTDGGAIYVGVPSASSLHRVLAHHAGLLSDIRVLSDTDRRFGHKRFLTHDDWMDLFSSLKLRVERAEGLYLKPLSTGQLESLKLDPRIYEALAETGRDLPQIANTCFYLLKND